MGSLRASSDSCTNADSWAGGLVIGPLCHPKPQLDNAPAGSRMRFLVWAVASALAAATILAALPILFGSSKTQIYIQWREVSEVERHTLEQQFALTESKSLREDTWSYVPTGISAEQPSTFWPS
jgi:hypothetical protein